MSAFYESASVAFALGLFWSILGGTLASIFGALPDYRPAATVASQVMKRGLVYGFAMWIALGASATLADRMRGPSGYFPADGLQRGVFSTTPSAGGGMMR